ncbi:hypothetical protein QR90_08390 [Deinococcus radiopugnans]|uniref:Phage tail protein domain-containing protein n=1 Tax=Deinococcus radiopugnans TaxID=57497 RepID=A0A0A7KIP9_9DEIO|nr:phage tail protein [Deinococcus radiopugnans]AIZ45119.1 hypothetical protein QR90_08390 [Deinococcus radiopugnans]
MKRAELERLLPEVLQRAAQADQPLGAALDVMAELITPLETALAQVDAVFDPHRTPDAFVPFLATWLDLDGLLRPGPLEQQYPAGLGQLRRLIARTMPLNLLRGTAQGLTEMLETATGVEGFGVRENVTAGGQHRAFHLLVLAPAAAAPVSELVSQLCEMEKPVALTHEIVWNAPGGAL